LFIDLTPLIPLSIIGRCILSMRGKRNLERGEAPLLLTPPSLIKGRGSGGWVDRSGTGEIGFHKEIS
jgi:hypothetical protein